MTHRQGHAVIIDDDILLCKYFERQFKRSGFQLHIAKAGREGLELVRDIRPDIVLLDVRLPDMDGIALCRELKDDNQTSHIPVIFVTASPDAYVRSFQAGAADCITKPIRSIELQARIAHVLRNADINGHAASAGQSREYEDVEQRCWAKVAANFNQTLGVMGHELRTPLAGLRAMSEHLLTEGAGGHPHSFVEAIHSETVRLSDMVNNMLEAARMNSGVARWNWDVVSLQGLCQGTTRILTPLVATDIRLVTDVQPDSLTMLGDADALHRLLLNLLSNSLKHTTSGTISVHARSGVEVDGSWIELTVADTGSGISCQALEKLGVPFALNAGVVDDSVSTGLGISICQNIAAAHGGNIEFWSNAGHGTIVTVRMRADLAQPLSASEFDRDMEAAA